MWEKLKDIKIFFSIILCWLVKLELIFHFSFCSLDICTCLDMHVCTFEYMAHTGRVCQPEQFQSSYS